MLKIKKIIQNSLHNSYKSYALCIQYNINKKYYRFMVYVKHMHSSMPKLKYFSMNNEIANQYYHSETTLNKR